ncbi:hypothetical protein E2C01_086238 [Portunus trituberculatus]|uniref:Uncharacterized protein n=1 Tax=Portunus trituberculatus TaxID=210409 RepID=A0A5B7JCX0_PORTR|nr:hypothetical protein [Portunus trituberculatus]
MDFMLAHNTRPPSFHTKERREGRGAALGEPPSCPERKEISVRGHCRFIPRRRSFLRRGCDVKGSEARLCSLIVETTYLLAPPALGRAGSDRCVL